MARPLCFHVTDTRTGKEPDLEAIALHEEWARGLVYPDMLGFTVAEDGSLYLLDECGNYAPASRERFRVNYADLRDAPVSVRVMAETLDLDPG